MQIFDRYLLRIFLKVLLVCFVSMTGLYIVIDGFGNLDEFLKYSEQQGPRVLFDYYSARVPWVFNLVGGLFTLVAAMFTVTWLQRTNELTALQAAGIPTKRIIKPIIVAALGVSVFGVLNRELLIPSVRPRLIRNAQDWLGDQARNVEPVTDNQTDILIGGRSSYANEQRIAEPTFTLHRQWGQFGHQISAANAYYEVATDGRPGGYRLKDVTEPSDHADLPSAFDEGQPIILSPLDTKWLAEDELFVASEVSFPHLAGGNLWRELGSTSELITSLRNPSFDFGLRPRVMIHARFVQPFLDMTLFFLGLPLVLSRQNRNIFLAAGWCVLIVIAYFVVVIVCQALGDSGFLLSPALAAWCPLIILAPIATAMSHPIWQ